MSGDLVTVEIRPGETTSVTFGGGISVVAKLLFPAGLQPRRDWQLFGSVQTPFPTVPAAIAKDPEALRSYYQSPEFEALRKTARQYPAVIEPDGTFTADDVAPGNYLVRVHVVSAGVDNQPPQTIAQAVRPITVPGDSSGGTIDAGEILIEPASAQ